MTSGVCASVGSAATPTKSKSLITTKIKITSMNREQQAILASTPGHILQQEFLEAFHLSQAELSKRTGIPRSTLNEIIKGKRPINAETALTLSIFFGTSPQFWINLQSQYDLRRVELGKAAQIRARVRPMVA